MGYSPWSQAPTTHPRSQAHLKFRKLRQNQKLRGVVGKTWTWLLNVSSPQFCGCWDVMPWTQNTHFVKSLWVFRGKCEPNQPGPQRTIRTSGVNHRISLGSLVTQMVKESAYNAGGLGSISGLGRSPGGEHSNPLQYSCLGNPRDRGAWWATVLGVVRELDTTKRLSSNGTELPYTYRQLPISLVSS